MLRRVGLVVTLLGGIAALVGFVLSTTWDQPDANIGAGMLVTIGLPVAGLGVLLLIIGSAVAAGRNRD
jgi:hypothetical protein